MGKPGKPTEAELSILGVLWQRGPSTVGQVRDAIHASKKTSKETGYTTVLKLMQIMTGKGLVTRDETLQAHVYQARLPKEQTQRMLVADLLDRAFEGSTSGLVIQALWSKRATPNELLEIGEILKDHERGWSSEP
jgi:BlaI family transcriptional regulator, penicillinase repressor